MLKAFAGFALPPEVTERAGCAQPTRVATGNWGAGAFLGDARLKALIQATYELYNILVITH